jgi:hypothetical protein
MITRLFATLRGLLGRRRIEGEIVEELRDHLEREIEAHRSRGVSPKEARRLALRDLGGLTQTIESTRTVRATWLDTVPRDVRFAIRRLGRERRLAVVCILTLAVAIGASTTIFSAVNAALIRPLPYVDADRLVQVWETNPQAERWGDWASYPDFADWSRGARVFEALALFRYGRLRMTYGEYPEMLLAVRVSPSLFPVLRVDPMLGRRFLADEGRPDRRCDPELRPLAAAIWFGSGIIGRPIPLDGRNHLHRDRGAGVAGSSTPCPRCGLLCSC